MQDLKFRKNRKRRHRPGKLEKKGLHFEKKAGHMRMQGKTRRVGRYARKDVIVWGAEILLVCIVASALVWFFGQRVSNAGDSMKPTLYNGDVVLVDHLVYDAVKPDRGDVIAFRPSGNENVHYSIKRIIGLPGETVQIREGSVYIDGEKLTGELYPTDIVYAGVAKDSVELGEGEYFVMGDDHKGSDDSRMAEVGNVKREEIYGKVWFVASFGENFCFVKQ